MIGRTIGKVNTEIFVEHKDAIELIKAMFLERAKIRNDRWNGWPSISEDGYWRVDQGRDQDAHYNYEKTRKATDEEIRIWSGLLGLDAYLQDPVRA